MSQRSPEALHAALAILNRPQFLRRARRSSLPRGITLLLEVAAGDRDAIREAQAVTGSSEALLTEAAGFFTEQVLLNRSSDSYRILGADSSASPSQLRRHMALIPTAKNYDIFAHCRWVRVAMLSGAAMNAFQASQQASTMSS